MFMGLDQEPIYVPDAVRYEVHDTPTRKTQFSHAPEVYSKLPKRLVKSLSDTPTEALEKHCLKVFQQPLQDILNLSSDKGEHLALIHASRYASEGERVRILCDDGPATTLIEQAQVRLNYEQRLGRASANGSIAILSSIDILERAIASGAFEADKVAFRKKYLRMSQLDSSLPGELKNTHLLKSPPWP